MVIKIKSLLYLILLFQIFSIYVVFFNSQKKNK